MTTLPLDSPPQALTGSQRVPIRVYRLLLTGGHTLDFTAVADSSGGDHGMRDQALARAKAVLGKDVQIEGVAEVRLLGWLTLSEVTEHAVTDTGGGE